MVSTESQPRVDCANGADAWAKRAREQMFKKMQQRAALRVEYRFIAGGKKAREYREAAN